MPTPSTLRFAKCLERADPEVERLEEVLHETCRTSRPDFLTRLAAEHLLTGGKRLRARLALAAAEALEIETDPLPWAAACELVHNASLVHDDVQDRDATRRGHPAVWVRCGVAQAINLGDFMLMLPASAIQRLECADSVRWRLMAAVARRAQATALFQARELELRRHGTLDFEEWLRVAAGKTGELFALPVEGAALLGGATGMAAASMGDVFRHVGVAYQLADDLADASNEGGAKAPEPAHPGENAVLMPGAEERIREIAAEIEVHPALEGQTRLKQIALCLVESFA